MKDFDVKRIIGRGNFADVKLAKETIKWVVRSKI